MRQHSIITVGVLGLLAWELAGRLLGLRPDLLPTPSRILLEIWQQAQDLRGDTLITGFEILGGLLLTLVVGIPCAFLLGSSENRFRLARPYLVTMQRLPLVAIAPAVIVWFGFGTLPSLLVPFLLSFGSILLKLASGFSSLSPEVVALLKTARANPMRGFFKVRLPAGLPHLFGALNIAIAWSIVGALVREFIGADQGLGHRLLAATTKFNMPLVFAIFAILAAMSATLNGAVRILEISLIPWNDKVQGQDY